MDVGKPNLPRPTLYRRCLPTLDLES